MIHYDYEGFVRARSALLAARRHTVIDEIYMPARAGMRYRVGRTLVTLGTQLMGTRPPADLRQAA